MTVEFTRVASFEWDLGNIAKNLLKHNVNYLEAEEIFNDPHKVVYSDETHSEVEKRHIILGKTVLGRLLYVVFTVRKDCIRVVSARDLNRKEVYLYEEKIKDSKI